MRWRSTFLVVSSLLCVACGPISKLPPLASEEIEAEQRRQQVDHIRDYFAQRGRLNNVAFRIRVANHHDCKSIGANRFGRGHGAELAAQIPLALS